MKQWINDRALAAKVWWRDRKERAEAKKALRATDHHHGRFFLLNVPATATVLAAFVEVYWAVLFCIEATGQLDGNVEWATGSQTPLTFLWNFAFSGHLPVLLGLVAATAPIVMISMVWLPVQFAMRGFGRWRRGTLIAVGLLANLLVIVSGTVVMNHNRQAQVRESLVVEQSADAGRAAIGARLQVAQTELARITAEGNTSNEARAARAGVAGWQTYIREATTDPSVPAADRQRIVRAMGSAEAADALRRRIEDLTVQQATAAPTAATAAVVEDTTGAGLNQFAQAVTVWRPPFVALICTLIGVLGAWWTLAMLEGLNPKDVLRSGWAPEEMRIEDHSEEAPIPAQPMKPPREVVRNAETGEEEIRIEPKPYWRKRKGKPQRVLTPVDGMQVQYEGETFVARDVVEKDGRSATPESLADSGDEPDGDEPEHNNEQSIHATDHSADDDTDANAADEISVEPAQPEPSETALADLDTLATLNSADEPKQHSTDDRADDAPAEEVSEPAIVADEADALAEDEDVFHDEPARETRPERLLAAAK